MCYSPSLVLFYSIPFYSILHLFFFMCYCPSLVLFCSIPFYSILHLLFYLCYSPSLVLFYSIPFYSILHLLFHMCYSIVSTYLSIFIFLSLVSIYNLGRSYYNGDGVASDKVKSFALFSQAAAKGYASAMNYMGIQLELGEGCERSEQKVFSSSRLHLLMSLLSLSSRSSPLRLWSGIRRHHDTTTPSPSTTKASAWSTPRARARTWNRPCNTTKKGKAWQSTHCPHSSQLWLRLHQCSHSSLQDLCLQKDQRDHSTHQSLPTGLASSPKRL